jgi:hypothetical protein
MNIEPIQTRFRFQAIALELSDKGNNLSHAYKRCSYQTNGTGTKDEKRTVKQGSGEMLVLCYELRTTGSMKEGTKACPPCRPCAER